MSKPGKSLKGLCKKLGIRLTVKRGKKRVYKSVKVLKKQCKNKKKKTVKKRKSKRKFGKKKQKVLESTIKRFAKKHKIKLGVASAILGGLAYEIHTRTRPMTKEERKKFIEKIKKMKEDLDELRPKHYKEDRERKKREYEEADKEHEEEIKRIEKEISDLEKKYKKEKNPYNKEKLFKIRKELLLQIANKEKSHLLYYVLSYIIRNNMAKNSELEIEKKDVAEMKKEALRRQKVYEEKLDKLDERYSFYVPEIEILD